MIGGTMQGQSWISQAPFIKSVELMIPFLLWRIIGGTFMFLSHLIFAYNVYIMKPAPIMIQNQNQIGDTI